MHTDRIHSICPIATALAERLETLRSLAREAFPRARQFIRPGFDEASR